jgi:hypothetical protein
MNSKHYYQTILWSLTFCVFMGLLGSFMNSHKSQAKPKQSTFKKINFDKTAQPEDNDSLL